MIDGNIHNFMLIVLGKNGGWLEMFKLLKNKDRKEIKSDYDNPDGAIATPLIILGMKTRGESGVALSENFGRVI